MFDLRKNSNIINLNEGNVICLKDGKTYIYEDSITGKKWLQN